MASSLSPYFITPTTTTTTTNRHIKPPSATNNNNNKWWTPLFGVPSDPDYIQTTTNTTDTSAASNNNNNKFAPGCFTEEKAKQLRMKTVEMSNFHDVMYHSAIASRLASDVTRRNGGR